VHDLENLPGPSGRSRRATRADRAALLDIDARAFDDFWQFDAFALREAVRATPRAHLRVAPRASDPLRSYGLFGRAGSSGYVQRLATVPEAEGRGFGSAVLNDGLRWLRARGASRAFVNTQHENGRALALYERAGFNQLPVGLCVLGRDL
jgi:ribosomal protein S18 acetylase RimI-like enzyme